MNMYMMRQYLLTEQTNIMMSIEPELANNGILDAKSGQKVWTED